MKSVLFCQVEVPATGRTLAQRSQAECGASECDREASIRRRPWPTRGCYVPKNKSVSNADSVVECMDEERNIN